MHGSFSQFATPRARCLVLFAGLAVLAAQASHAQLLRGRLRGPAPQVDAIAGEPYGVGRWIVQLPPGANPALLGNSGFTLSEKNDRARFQAFQAEPVRSAAREIMGRPQLATVYFLFSGTEPLELELHAPTAVTTTVVPRSDAVAHAQLLSDWWVRFARQAGRIDRPGDYPALVDNYLLATLSRRLGLPPASEVPPPQIRTVVDSLLGAVSGNPLSGASMETGDTELDQQLGLLFGADRLRSSMHAQVLARRSQAPEPADQPLPAGPTFTANVPETLDEVKIEPIALRVPAECFYVRFGNFSNYVWFRDTLARWGGDFQNLFSRRGLDFDVTARMERQISLKMSVLAPLLGPAVITDVAMIGSDAFFREGASFGMLFQARNNLGLSTDFKQQRAETLKREAGCTEQQVDIAGHKVSFLSTPDNSVRSFYAVDGDYHLVTNSRWLVERFFQAASAKNGLGATQEFRFARSRMPDSRNDTVFAYLSGEFFRNLAGPQYQIEMRRRMRSAAEIDMALVARLAARSEGRDDASLEKLIAAGYLPEGFGERTDGSQLGWQDGRFVDTLRGGRGSFAPIPDVTVEKVTAAEARRYSQFVNWFQANWSQLDPVVAGIRREPGKTRETEHIVLDVQLTPLAVKNYQTLATALGPISRQRLARIPGDVVSGEIIFSGNLLAARGMAQPQGTYRAFGGLRDAEVLNPAQPGNQPAAAARQVTINGMPLDGLLGGMPGAGGQSMMPLYYFGAHPTPAIFSWLGVEQVPLDAGGFGRSRNGLWQRREGQFTTASPSREVLEIVTPQLQFVDAPRPAQVWLQVGDLGRSKVASTINGLFYRGAKNAAIGNVRFLHSLTTQLHVPVEDAMRAVEEIVDAKFICPLGGTYELQQRAGGVPTWASTRLPLDRMRLVDGLFDAAPAEYSAPVLDWLRGLELDVALQNRTLSVHGEVEMERAAPHTAATNRTSVSRPALPSWPALTAPKNQQQPKAARPRGEELPTPTP